MRNMISLAGKTKAISPLGCDKDHIAGGRDEEDIVACTIFCNLDVTDYDRF